jgi:hypothetical protein
MTHIDGQTSGNLQRTNTEESNELKFASALHLQNEKLWERGTPNNDIRDSANHGTSDEEAENIDTILPRTDPIPRALHRITLEDNHKNGGNAREYH